MSFGHGVGCDDGPAVPGGLRTTSWRYQLLACVLGSVPLFWVRSFAVKDQFSAALIFGLVTLSYVLAAILMWLGQACSIRRCTNNVLSLSRSLCPRQRSVGSAPVRSRTVRVAVHPWLKLQSHFLCQGSHGDVCDGGPAVPSGVHDSVPFAPLLRGQGSAHGGVLISGFVIFVVAYHVDRIFRSWVGALTAAFSLFSNGVTESRGPTLTGVPLRGLSLH
jgi:hypothetical protein